MAEEPTQNQVPAPSAAPAPDAPPLPAVLPSSPAAEKPLWSGRSHWTHYAGTAALGILAIVAAWAVLAALAARGTITGGRAGLWGAALTLALAVVFGVRILWRILSCRYRLTTQRLFVERGVFSLTVDQSELIRVDDVRVRKTFVDRMLGLGSVEVISTDATDKALLITGIKEADLVAEQIRAHMRAMRTRSLYVESL